MLFREHGSVAPKGKDGEQDDGLCGQKEASTRVQRLQYPNYVPAVRGRSSSHPSREARTQYYAARG